WVRLARTCETHGCTLLVSAPYALTGTTSEAMLVAQRVRPQWLGSGKSPRVLAGVEMTVRLEKHRRIRPGQSVRVALRTVDSMEDRHSCLSLSSRPRTGESACPPQRVAMS